MKIVVNGEPTLVEDGDTVAGLLERLGRGPKGIAVAVNGDVVPRSRWGARPLAEDDRVEVLAAAQGG